MTDVTTETTQAATPESGAAATPTAETPIAAAATAAAARPDWLPEAMWDAKGGRVAPAAEKFVDLEAKTVLVDAVAKRALDAERELTRLKETTRPAKNYTIKMPEGSAAPEWTDPEHPIVQSFLGAVTEGKLSESQADVVVAKFVAAFDQSVEYEMDKLAKSSGVDREALKPRLDALCGRIKAVAGGDEEARATLHLWASSARGVELLEAALDGTLASKAGRYVAAPGAGAGEASGGVTEADLYALKRTEEYQRGDPKAVARKNEILAALYGGAKQDVAHIAGRAR